MRPDDIEEVKRLHKLYYPDFRFPDFYELMCGFIIEDDNDIIIAGGVEAIGESLLVTNKEKSRIKIGKALVEAQRASVYVCQRFGIKELHAFVDNPEYARHLIQHGFEPRDEQVLRMRVPDGKEK